MTSAIHLKRKQYLACAVLGVATALFFITLFWQPTFWARLLKAGSEAAMVGGLADWFAVVALFRHPLGLPIPHTAIIPTSKNRIAESLATFVRDKFLTPEAVVSLVRSKDVATKFADWLNQPSNARRIGLHAADLMRGVLNLVDDRHIRGFINDAARTMLGRIDFSRALGSVLEMLTQGGRHQQLLDAVLEHAQQFLRNTETQKLIAERVVRWLKEEHKWKQMVLPTEWLGEKAAEAASDGVRGFLAEVANAPAHEVRTAFDKALQTLITKLKTDETFLKKGEDLRAYVLQNPEFAEYSQSVWVALRDWLSNDLGTHTPQLQQQVERMGLWLGHKVSQDAELRNSLNQHIESFAATAAPQFADFLTSHISDTVRKWDVKDMSRQIELSIGPDLQYIRISGTVVGCCIGIFLFLVSHFSQMP